MARSTDPAYRMYTANGHQDFYTKKDVAAFLKKNDGVEVKQIKWYKGCGQWVDVTEKYI